MRTQLGVVATMSQPRRPNVSADRQPFAATQTFVRNVQSLLSAREDVERTGVVCQHDGRRVRLLRSIASGGEGTVYKTDQPGMACKIYHDSRLTAGAQRKLALMTTLHVTHPAICWPVGSVADEQGVFRGFLMPCAAGEPLGHGLFIPTVWQSKHRSWTRRESVALALRVLDGIHHLHRLGILLGDINPMNILVKDETTVFFVDCDSYQVGQFPCPVGAVNFVAPEIQGEDFGKFLRTLEHELFAVATLLFMILMPGKPPYSHRGGADGAANIKKMHFPYPLGEKGADGAPGGAWRFCWSHLTRQIKDSFYRSFHAEFRGQPRVQVAEWIRLLDEYYQVLARPSATFHGPTPSYGFDLSIMPQNFRYIQGVGRELPKDGMTDLQRSVQRMAAASAQIASRRPTRQTASPQLAPCGKSPHWNVPAPPQTCGPVAALLRLLFR